MSYVLTQQTVPSLACVMTGARYSGLRTQALSSDSLVSGALKTSTGWVWRGVSKSEERRQKEGTGTAGTHAAASRRMDHVQQRPSALLPPPVSYGDSSGES